MGSITNINFFFFSHAGETTVPSEDSCNTNSHLPYNDIAINDAKASSIIISLLIKQSKTDQERVGTKVLIGKTGYDICLINSFLHICQGEKTNLGLYSNGKKVPF